MKSINFKRLLFNFFKGTNPSVNYLIVIFSKILFSCLILSFLTAAVAVDRTWTGAVNSNWNTGGNWNPSGVPAVNDSVIIPDMTTDPVISSNAVCNDLLIKQGGFLLLNTGRTLDVNGNLSIGDSVTATNGILTLAGSASLTIGGDYYKRDNANLNSNSSSITFDGGGDQKIASGGINPLDKFNNIIINKTGGTVLLLDDIYLNGSFTISNGSVDANGFDIIVENNWDNSGTFTAGSGTVTFKAGTSGPFTINGGSSAFNNMTINGVSTSIYRLVSTLDVNRNLTITRGLLDMNGQSLEFGSGVGDVLTVRDILELDDSAVLQMTDDTEITVMANGTLRVLGSSLSNRPTITHLNTGNYSVNVQGSGKIDAKYAIFEYTAGNGIDIAAGATIASNSKFDSTLFQNGTGTAYLTIANSQSLTMSGVKFDSAATNRNTYNVVYSGTGNIAFSNYRGTMSGVNFENDNGTGTRGNVRWYFTQMETVSSSQTFGNDAELTTVGTLGDVTVVLTDNTLPGADSTVARYYTIQPTNSETADLRLYYGDDELQNEVESNLMIWMRRNGSWTNLGGNVNTSKNYVEVIGGYSPAAGVTDTLVLSDASEDSGLPVELSVFTAYIQGENIVLGWQTESEIDNSHWVIERKLLFAEEYDQIVLGELLLENSFHPFNMIAIIKGQGSKSTATTYKYTDNQVNSGEIYAYRLSDVSISGEVTYHKPVFVLPNLVPGEFELWQNYPNPFNPTTTIQYNVPITSRVTVTIYNLLGQEVITLFDDEQLPGSYKIVWDAKNQAGSRVASGTYFYQMNAEAGEGDKRFSESKKMIIMR
jgi:hypothetical protein